VFIFLQKEMTLRDFLEQHTQIIQPLYKRTCESYRIASLSGKAEDYAASEQAQLAYNEIYTDAEAFAQIQKLASEEQDRTPILKREYETIYRAYLSSQ